VNAPEAAALPVPAGWAPGRWSRSIGAAALGTLLVVLNVLAAAVDGGSQRPGVAVALAAFWYLNALLFAPRERRAVEPRDGRVVFGTSRVRVAAQWATRAVICASLASAFDGTARLACVAIFVVAAAVAALLGFQGGTLSLDAEGVTYAAGARRRRCAWDELGPVEAKRWGVLDTRGLGRVRLELLADDPVVVYWTLDRYATTPAARAELATFAPASGS